MELIAFFTSLTQMGLSPSVIALVVLLWKLDKRLTIIEIILENKD